MIHIKLGERRPAPAADAARMGRDWVGWDKNASLEDLWAHNRGCWLLGARADRERYAAFSHQGEIKFVAEIEGFEPFDNRRAMIGRPLPLDDPISLQLVEKEAPDPHRNPVTYFIPEGAGASTCACGCGESVPASRSFVPGHDQKAIHERITRRWGGTLGFIRWFDEAFPA